MPIYSNILLASAALLFVGCASTNQENPIYQQSTVYKGSVPSTGNIQQASYSTRASSQIPYAAQPIRQASYTRVNSECLSREGNRKLIGGAAGGVIGALAGRKLAGDNKTLGTVAGGAIGVAAGYGIAGKTINCDPITVPASAQTATMAPTYHPTTQYTPAYNTNDLAQTVTVPVQPSITETTASFGDAGTPGYYAVTGQVQPQTLIAVSPLMTPAPAPTTHRAIAIANTQARIRSYTLAPGDTVYSLARNNCSTVAELRRINGINEQFYIRAGDQIILPSYTCPK
ncbi:MAG: LysM peptidoglycan-binding domain-containing protein [Robiginitomaculum sp.]